MEITGRYLDEWHTKIVPDSQDLGGLPIAQLRFVAANGNDTTGNGSIEAPYLTLPVALAGILDASATKRYVVFVTGDVTLGAPLVLPPNIFIRGGGILQTRLTCPDVQLSAAAWDAAPNSAGGFADLTLDASVHAVLTTAVQLQLQNVSALLNITLTAGENSVLALSNVSAAGSIFTQGLSFRSFGSRLAQVEVYSDYDTFALVSQSDYMQVLLFTRTQATGFSVSVDLGSSQFGQVQISGKSNVFCSVPIPPPTLNAINGALVTNRAQAATQGAASSRRWTSGAGAPNGLVVGNVGDLFTRTDGAASSTLYVKEAGIASSSGWNPAGGSVTRLGNYRFVAATGNDTTGDGSIAKPYATIQAALASIPTTAGINDPYIVYLASSYSGVLGDIALPGGVFICGASPYATAISANQWTMAPDPNTNPQPRGFINCRINGDINFTRAQTNGYGTTVYFENCQLANALTCTGHGAQLVDSIVTGAAALNDAFFTLTRCTVYGAVTHADVTSGFTRFESDGSRMPSLSVKSLGGNSTFKLLGTQIDTTLTIDGVFTPGSNLVDARSLPPTVTLVSGGLYQVTGGAIRTRGVTSNQSRQWSSGNGTPEAAVVGSPGDLFTNTAGGASTTLYVKTTGVNTNTGWTAK